MLCATKFVQRMRGLLKDLCYMGYLNLKIANKEKQLKGVWCLNGNRMIFMSRNCVKNAGGSFELVILIT